MVLERVPVAELGRKSGVAASAEAVHLLEIWSLKHETADGKTMFRMGRTRSRKGRRRCRRSQEVVESAQQISERAQKVAALEFEEENTALTARLADEDAAVVGLVA